MSVINMLAMAMKKRAKKELFREEYHHFYDTADGFNNNMEQLRATLEIEVEHHEPAEEPDVADIEDVDPNAPELPTSASVDEV